jgi:hypothetical protein
MSKIIITCPETLPGRGPNRYHFFIENGILQRIDYERGNYDGGVIWRIGDSEDVKKKIISRALIESIEVTDSR